MSARRLPEFQVVLSALSAQLKAENKILEGQKQAFGREFRAFAESQSDSLKDCLLSICDAGHQQSVSTQETESHIRSLPRDLRPILSRHSEMAGPRQFLAKLQSSAAKSQAAVEKAEGAAARARESGKPSADIEKAAACRSSADADNRRLREQQEINDQTELAYRRRFLEALVTPLTAALNVRAQAAKRNLVLASELQVAAERMRAAPGAALAALQEQLREAEQWIVE
jgi:hypothetical protein